MSSDLRLLAFLWACETQMAKVIDAQSKQLDTQSQEIRSQAKQIEAFRQENAEMKAQIAAILAKLDK